MYFWVFYLSEISLLCSLIVLYSVLVHAYIHISTMLSKLSPMAISILFLCFFLLKPTFFSEGISTFREDYT